LNNSEIMAMFKHHYNSFTAENAMKPVYISSAPGVYDFSEADKMVNWACDNEISVVGHTLIWHGQSAVWLNRNEDGSPITRAAARANMEAFIKAYVSRYSGKIHSWDVINEVFRDSDKGFEGCWRDYLRRESDNPRAVGHWYLAYANGAKAGESGADFVFDAYYFARKYDPKAVLYYNEYNEEYPAKREAIARMVEEINEQWKAHAEYYNRLLIEGIGMQSHHNHLYSKLENVRAAIERFAKTGARIAVTEFDFTFGSSEEPANPLTPEQSKKQAEMLVGLFEIYMEFSKHVERVTVWGKDDKKSWRSWGSPTFFDEEGNAKEAFHAVVGLANGKKKNFDCACQNRNCPRHGDCTACKIAHDAHAEKTGEPAPRACER